MTGYSGYPGTVVQSIAAPFNGQLRADGCLSQNSVVPYASGKPMLTAEDGYGFPDCIDGHWRRRCFSEGAA